MNIDENAESSAAATLGESPIADGLNQPEKNAVIPVEKYEKTVSNMTHRIQGMTSEAAQLKSKLEAAQAEVERLRQPKHAADEPTAASLGIDPYDELGAQKLNDAKIKYYIAKQKEDLKRELLEEQQREREATQRRSIQDSFQGSLNVYAAKNPQYNQDLAMAAVGPSDTVLDLVSQVNEKSGQGEDLRPALTHHLIKNPEELNRINSMSPSQAAIRIGQLTSKLQGATSVTKNITNAPATGTNLTGGGGTLGESLENKEGDAFYEAYYKRTDPARYK